MTDDSVTYIDTGIGKDGENEIVTISKSDFLRAWQGNVLLESTTAQTVIASPTQSGEAISGHPRLLSVQETQQIRGAFFVFLIPFIISAFTAISASLGAILASIAAIATTIGSFIGTAIAMVGSAIGSLVAGIGSMVTTIFQGIHFGLTSLFGTGLGGTATAAASGGFFGGGIGSIFSGAGAFKLLIGTGINMGLNALGVSPEISSLVSAFTTGGIINGLGSLGGFLSAGAQNLINVIPSVLSPILNLDPTLSASLGILAGGFSDGIAQLSIPGGFTTVVSDALIKAGTFYGASQLGNSLGLDISIVSAFALPILGGIGRSIDAGQLIGEDLVQSIVDGITGSAIQFGFDFAIEEMDIDNPLLESLTSAVLTSTISSFLDPNGNVIEDLLTKAGEYGQKFLGEITSSSFMYNALQYGLEETLESYATSMFSRGALEEIHKVGGIAQIISGRSELVDYNGTTLTKVNITDKEGFVLDQNGGFVGTYRLSPGGVLEETFGQFDVSTGQSKLINGTVRQLHADGSVSYIEVRDGKSYRLVFKGYEESQFSEATVETFSCAEYEAGCTRFDLGEGSFEPIWDWEVIENYSSELNINGFDITDGLQFINGEVTFSTSDGLQEIIGADNLNIQNPLNLSLTSNFTSHLFGNGFENLLRAENTPDPLLKEYVLDLQNEDNLFTESQKIVVDLYEMTGLKLNAIDWALDFDPVLVSLVSPLIIAIDRIIQWTSGNDDVNGEPSSNSLLRSLQERLAEFADNTGFGNNLVIEVIRSIEKLQRENGKLKNAVTFTHSGFTSPVLTAIDTMDYDVDTVLIYEGPHLNYKHHFTHSKLRRIIHVRGTGDVADEDAFVPYLGWAEFTSDRRNFYTGEYEGIDNVNIEILGAFHSDYSYDAAAYQPGGELYGATNERETINRRVNLFMRDLYAAANDDKEQPGRLSEFYLRLESNGAASKLDGRWIIDPAHLRDL